jgi:LmbE family N-acetylglucosaminyl deacetylase
VITVCAAVPPQSWTLPEWDAACGFSSARQALLARRREDRSALEFLGADPCWLSCWDSQYRLPPAIDAVALRLARALRRHPADTVALPLGLFHGDHKRTHLAALKLLAARENLTWLAYEEPNYRCVPGELSARFGALQSAGVRTERFPFPADAGLMNLKAAAAKRYESQLRGLASAGRPGDADLYAPERYWRLST